MSQLNFPTNPYVGQQHTIGVNVWEWNGSAWLKLVPPRNIATVFTVTERLDVTSSTNAIDTLTGALIVTGGVGIGQDVWIGGIAYSQGSELLTTATVNQYVIPTVITAGTDTAVNTSTGNITIWNISTLQSVTSRGSSTSEIITLTNLTDASNTYSGALVVSGGVGIGKNAYVGDKLVVESTGYDVSTPANNALDVKGGGYFENGLTVEGVATFKDIVVFNGTATYVYSTNTVYTDNLINLHTPPGGIGSPWTIDDGKDIGFIFHNYYQSADNDSFLGWANDTGYLEWYLKGTESISGVFTGTEYGTFKTGAIVLVNPITATNTASGTLIVDGGVGISQDVYIGGSTLVSGNIGIGTVNPTSTLHVAGTTFITGITTITNITSATSTVTGALQVAGGVSIVQDVHIGGNITVGPTIDNTVIPSIYSNNFILSSWTSPAISSTSTQNLDSWSTSTYRTVRYLVQVTDIDKIHISEMTIFHAGGVPYLNEYGVNYNNGELGVFDADIIAGDLTLQFIPTTATNMVIKVVRMGITI